MLRVRIGGTET